VADQFAVKRVTAPDITNRKGGAPIVVELYKLSTEPLKELSLINSKLSEGAISAEV
jgi:hypothetical protein